MDKHTMKSLVSDPRMIPGVYVYCDRWCERCHVATRCSVHAIAEAGKGEEGRDARSAAFWEPLHEMFAVTREMVCEKARELGVDLDRRDEAEVEVEEARRDRVADERPLSQVARHYMEIVQAWFEGWDALSAEKAAQLELAARLALPSANPEAEVLDLDDLVEVIRWYYMFIPAKVVRAVRQEDVEEGPSDADGSAKVALVAIDRSMAAWCRVRRHFPEQADAMLDFLVVLERLRRGVEHAFPNARAFVRLGLDEPAAWGADLTSTPQQS